MFLLEKKIAFVHIPRTGGMSIRKLLRPYCHQYMAGREHCHVSEVLREINSLFMTMKTFTVVRNPWDRIVSMYLRHIGKIGRDCGFRAFLEGIINRTVAHSANQCWHTHEVLNGSVQNGHDYWMVHEFGECLVDYVFRFEERDELERFLSHSLKTRVTLPHVNANVSRKHYSEYYDDEMIDMIGKMYAVDVDVFGYYYGGYYES